MQVVPNGITQHWKPGALSISQPILFQARASCTSSLHDRPQGILVADLETAITKEVTQCPEKKFNPLWTFCQIRKINLNESISEIGNTMGETVPRMTSFFISPRELICGTR
jgi:hypothetical protein